MVRSIRSCSRCRSRFVYHGRGRKHATSDPLCSGCSHKWQRSDRAEKGSFAVGSPDPLRPLSKENHSQTTPETKVVEGGQRDAVVASANQEESSAAVVHLPSEGFYEFCDEDDGDGGSEGGDDFYCTQIVESQDDNSVDEDEPEILEEVPFHPTYDNTPTIPSRKSTTASPHDSEHPPKEPLPSQPGDAAAIATTRTATAAKATSSSGGDICFICGADLSKLKRRIDHIKRCSKKHGITGRDVRTVGDQNVPTAASPPIVANTTREAETAQREEEHKKWHGDAETLLKLTEQDKCIALPSANHSNSGKTGPTGSMAPTKPSSSSSSWGTSGYDPKTGTFAASRAPGSATRNLNNVLMAGSRRLEVQSKAAHKRDEIERNNNNSNNNGNRKRSRYDNWNCPQYKKITGTDFVVDGFHYAKHSLTKNYFLTHFHSDHYGGITSSWDVGTIFCSLPTASLVSQQLRVDKKHIHPLPMNTPTVIESRGKAVTVTLLDANHCPGAVMFLFQIGKRTTLHVGDFRWSRDAMLVQHPSSPLHGIASQAVCLDELYLDTTYCNEKYQLPPQSATIQATIETFAKELERCKKPSNPPKKTLHLFGAYTIGKEKIFLSVAERFGLKLYVDKARHRILSTLNLPERYTKLLTTNKEMSDLWVVPMGHLNFKKMPEYFAIANSKPFANSHYDKIVGYRPTGWSLSRSGIISSRTSGRVAIHSVPYSEHSSFPELVDCIACLKPAKIIPTVSAAKSNEQVKLLLEGLRNKQRALTLFSSTKKTP